jgi:PIN domain nuclease of toxin-antitoxin system
LSIADVTVWEVASLCARGTLQIHGTVENTVQDLLIHLAVQVKPITPEIAVLATQFPNEYPRDPVDRLIGATARAEGLPWLHATKASAGAAAENHLVDPRVR